MVTDCNRSSIFKFMSQQLENGNIKKENKEKTEKVVVKTKVMKSKPTRNKKRLNIFSIYIPRNSLLLKSDHLLYSEFRRKCVFKKRK